MSEKFPLWQNQAIKKASLNCGVRLAFFIA